MNELELAALLAGERRSLAKAITQVESQRADHRLAAQSLLDQALPHSGKSVRVGISGVPGVGKSTFIEAFGLHLIEQGHRVAVLAVDPSSPLGGGSILGDKTRMEVLSREEHAFIRPSPSSGALGGVAHKTRETMLLCEAAGYDVVLVETVGVGQSEFEVAGMVDFFLVLMLPNAGDELQGIKKGIMELADALLINKADGDSVAMARQTQRHYENALHLLSANSFWTPQVMSCSALHNENIDAVWGMIQSYRIDAQKNGFWEKKRVKQNRQWMEKLLHELLQQRLNSHAQVSALRPGLEQQVMAGEITPYSAALTLIELLDA